MATMISEVYDAFRDAQGVSDEKARRAAEALADYDTRFTELKAEIADVRTELKAEIQGVRTELKADIADVRSDVKLLKWMSGFGLAFNVAILFRLITH